MGFGCFLLVGFFIFVQNLGIHAFDEVVEKGLEVFVESAIIVRLVGLMGLIGLLGLLG